MRIYVVHSALAGLALAVTLFLAACGSSAPAEQPAAAPTSTIALPTEAAATASGAGDTPSTPTPVATTDDGLEFLAPPDSLGASKRQEPLSGGDTDPSRKGAPGADGTVQGAAYTWEDGDRTLTVYLQEDMVVEKGSSGLPRDVVAADASVTNVVRGAVGQSKSDTLPVFRSESGELMTLPGGVLLVLDPEWSEAQVNSFLSENGIKQDRLSELNFAANGYFIETEPGFPSLNLANTLAALDGVVISSPNWGREAVPK